MFTDPVPTGISTTSSRRWISARELRWVDNDALVAGHARHPDCLDTPKGNFYYGNLESISDFFYRIGGHIRVHCGKRIICKDYIPCRIHGMGKSDNIAVPGEKFALFLGGKPADNKCSAVPAKQGTNDRASLYRGL